VLRREAGVRTPIELRRRAEAWRPWRAYAVIALWQGATDGSRSTSVVDEEELPSEPRIGHVSGRPLTV
jgi:hypothetical protein